MLAAVAGPAHADDGIVITVPPGMTEVIVTIAPVAAATSPGSPASAGPALPVGPPQPSATPAPSSTTSAGARPPTAVPPTTSTSTRVVPDAGPRPAPAPRTTQSPAPTSSPSDSGPTPTANGRSATTTSPANNPTVGSTSAWTRLWGSPPRSGLPWGSGIWWGDHFTPGDIEKYGSWRGAPIDMVTVYAAKEKGSWEELRDTWSIREVAHPPVKLSYGLPLLPKSARGDFAQVYQHDDDVWRYLASQLAQAGHGDAMVRLAWEANIKDWPWYATADSAAQFKEAWRHVATTMKAVAPGLKFEFGINAGSSLAGSDDRMAPLSVLYPGDDVVDVIGGDSYNWWHTTVTDSETQWQNYLHPTPGAGLGDVLDFARQHGKVMSIGEWGNAHPKDQGIGDQPYYVTKMLDWVRANADTIAVELFFDEHDKMSNSLLEGDMPASAKVYQQAMSTKSSDLPIDPLRGPLAERPPAAAPAPILTWNRDAQGRWWQWQWNSVRRTWETVSGPVLTKPAEATAPEGAAAPVGATP